MQQAIPQAIRNEKLDGLIRCMLSRPEGTMSYDEFCFMEGDSVSEEPDQLLDQLLEDKLINFRVGPQGLELALTEDGIESIVMGGYCNSWVPMRGWKQARRRKIRGFLVLLFFYLSLFACAYFSLRR
jgi:hypothetical protein